MPKKIKDLIRELEQAGFTNRGGKGSHRNFQHGNIRITLSGQLGDDDAKPYQECEVKAKILESKQ